MCVHQVRRNRHTHIDHKQMHTMRHACAVHARAMIPHILVLAPDEFCVLCPVVPVRQLLVHLRTHGSDVHLKYFSNTTQSVVQSVCPVSPVRQLLVHLRTCSSNSNVINVAIAR